MKQLELIDRRIIMLISFLFIFLTSCQHMRNQTEDEKDTLEKSVLVCDSGYPEKYEDQKIRAQLNEAKWNLYLYAVVDTPKNSEGSFVSQNPKSYASYPLILDTLYTYNGSTFILFSFCIDGELVTKDKAYKMGIKYVPESISLAKTVNGKESRCVNWRGLTDGDNFCMETLNKEDIEKFPKHYSKQELYEMRKSSNRLIYPLNPAIVNYIESNKENLDVWFITEAKRRGIIK